MPERTLKINLLISKIQNFLRKFHVNLVRSPSPIRAGARGFTSNGVKITVPKANVKAFAPGLAFGVKRSSILHFTAEVNID